MATAKKQRTSKIASILPAPVQVEQVEQTAPIEAPTPAEVPPPPAKGQGIGKLVKELITEGLNNDEVLERVRGQFPSASTNKACISWYRSAMKKAAAK